MPLRALRKTFTEWRWRRLHRFTALAWILAVVEGLIAAVAATTGLHLGVWIRDQLRGR